MNLKHILLILIAASLLITAGCKQTPAQVNEAPVYKVRVMEVKAMPRAELYSVSGRVMHSDETFASFKTGGILQKLLVDEGDSFTKGQLLAMLDTTEIAAIARTALGYRDKLERDHARIEKLYEEKVVSLEQLQDITTALNTARADAQRAEFNLQRSMIRAPFDGIVAMRMKNEGEMVDSGHPVFRLVEINNRLIAKVTVPARFVNSLSIGDSVKLAFDEAGIEKTGAISELGAVALPGTGHYEVEISFAVDPQLREGMAVRAFIPGPEQSAIALPTSALVTGDKDRGRIYLAVDSLAQLVPVEFIGFEDDSVLIKATLPSGSKVVTEGAGFLRDGARLQIVERDL
ncbi:efflux RND transporter periplasmic adaptor subunit [bacterium]|nr:efflux RND transporter periplasmic adaptor subunit [bacterium]